MTELFGTQRMPPDMQVEPPIFSCFSMTKRAGARIDRRQSRHHAAATRTNEHDVE